MTKVDGRSTWTTEEISSLTKLFEEGHSMTEIGRRMNKTPYQVSGKLGRMGLERGTNPMAGRLKPGLKRGSVSATPHPDNLSQGGRGELLAARARTAQARADRLHELRQLRGLVPLPLRGK